MTEQLSSTHVAQHLTNSSANNEMTVKAKMKGLFDGNAIFEILRVELDMVGLLPGKDE